MPHPGYHLPLPGTPGYREAVTDLLAAVASERQKGMTIEQACQRHEVIPTKWVRAALERIHFNYHIELTE
jgi:hypothetical protein